MAIPLHVIANDIGHPKGTVRFSPVAGAVELTIVIEEHLHMAIVPAYLIYGLNLKIDTLETIALVINNKIISIENVTISSDNDKILLELEDEYDSGLLEIIIGFRITRKDISPPGPSECRPHHHHHHHPSPPGSSEYHPHHSNPFI